MNTIRIYGAGGLGREVAAYFKEQQESVVLEFIVDRDYLKSHFVDGIVVKPDSSIEQGNRLIVAIGDPKVKDLVVKNIQEDVSFATIVHDTAYVSNYVEIGEGCIIAPGDVVSNQSIIGSHVLLNYNCTLGHDVKLGDFVSVYPGATISGNVTIGDRVTIGANSSIREGVSIAADAIIGMGSVVLNDISEPGTYVGNPIRKIK